MPNKPSGSAHVSRAGEAALARVFDLDHYLGDILASAFVAVLLAFGLAKAFRIQPIVRTASSQ